MYWWHPSLQPQVLWSAVVRQQSYCSIISKMPEAKVGSDSFQQPFLVCLFFIIALLSIIFHLGLYSCLENAFCAKSLTATFPNARPKWRLLLSARFDFMLFYPFRTVLSYILWKNFKGWRGWRRFFARVDYPRGLAGFCCLFGVFSCYV